MKKDSFGIFLKTQLTDNQINNPQTLCVHNPEVSSSILDLATTVNKGKAKILNLSFFAFLKQIIFIKT